VKVDYSYLVLLENHIVGNPIHQELQRLLLVRKMDGLHVRLHTNMKLQIFQLLRRVRLHPLGLRRHGYRGLRFRLPLLKHQAKSYNACKPKSANHNCDAIKVAFYN
jgi:hypothetical protein